MRKLAVVSAVAVVSLWGIAEAQTAQPEQSGVHGHAHGAAPAAGSAAHHEVQRCQADYEAVVRDGRGFGMAFAADQNGYPGPLHVLELRDALALSAEQEARARALYHAMLHEARPLGAALLDAEGRLRALFESGTAAEAAVRAQVAEVERRRGELRTVHLLYHLRTRDLLAPGQRTTYHALRWPAAPARP